MERVEIVRIDDEDQLAHAFRIRRSVFVEEQGVPLELEFDAHDATARHLLARAGDRAVGTLRVRLIDGSAKIERVAVLREARGLKVGRELLRAALEVAERAGARESLLHAQVQVQGFYETLGFAAYGATFVEDGILHVAMRRPAGGPGTRDDAA